MFILTLQNLLGNAEQYTSISLPLHFLRAVRAVVAVIGLIRNMMIDIISYSVPIFPSVIPARV